MRRPSKVSQVSTPVALEPLPNPQRGEVWCVEFDPARGDEIRKLRPAVVVSVATAGKLALARDCATDRLASRVCSHFLAHAYPTREEQRPDQAQQRRYFSGALAFSGAVYG